MLLTFQSQKVGRECAQGVLTRLTFRWVSPLLALGMQRPLQQDDLFQLQPALMPAACSQRLWVRDPQHMDGWFLHRLCLESASQGREFYSARICTCIVTIVSAQHFARLDATVHA